jgi:hypothetical protein
VGGWVGAQDITACGACPRLRVAASCDTLPADHSSMGWPAFEERRGGVGGRTRYNCMRCVPQIAPHVKIVWTKYCKVSQLWNILCINGGMKVHTLYLDAMTFTKVITCTSFNWEMYWANAFWRKRAAAGQDLPVRHSGGAQQQQQQRQQPQPSPSLLKTAPR